MSRESMRLIALALPGALLAVAAGACASRHASGGDGGVAGGGGGAGAGASSDGVALTLALPTGSLRVELCAANLARIAFAPDASFFTRASITTAARRCEPTPFTRSSQGGQTTIATRQLGVRVDEGSGAVTFLDPAGTTVLAEIAGGRTLTPAMVQGEATTSARQQWAPRDDESLYGLGQHQQGLFDLKGTDLTLHQYNTEVFIPYLVSSQGYGILWDNTSLTRFGDLDDPVPLPGTTGLYLSGGDPGVVDPGKGIVAWTGLVTPEVSGDTTFRTYSSGQIRLTVGDQVVIDHWRQGWAPDEDLAHVTLTAGQPVVVRLEWTNDLNVGNLRLLWKPPAAGSAPPTTALWSQVADGVDYWFVYGPTLDQVVAGYRRLTGEAPLLPRWAYGFWQSRDHYLTAQEVTDVLAGYRARGAPIDSIVQDWQYWPDGQWGSHDFNAGYPDPAGWIQSIHDTYHAHLMISVWPKFYPETDNFQAFQAASATSATPLLYQPNLVADPPIVDFKSHVFTFYDAFNPTARQLYWSQIDGKLFSKGVDAWWMDATEPEIVEGPFASPAAQIDTNQTHMNPTAAGSGARVLNAYPLMNSRAIYEGQRASAPGQRVFILTRSAFAGQQRFGATTWSGDVSATWTGLRKQIPAGLNFALSGMPYWTVDSGGYAVPPAFRGTSPTRNPPTAADDEWRELATRWFEYATFLPIMRVHGQAPARELWQFGGDTSPAYQAMLKFDRLRYRLLPYVYSLAALVTRAAGTILRPLVMDFPTDGVARAVADQFMFGPALLVSPVTSYQARARSVVLPVAAGWYDVWTGAYQNGGQTLAAAAADFDAIPVFARAGSIVPLGPDLQYSDEKPADPITLYVYAGADGAFTLYEDQGTTTDYEGGAFSTIPLTWSDATRTLTIGARSGAFTGMLGDRTFDVVVVDPTHPAGFGAAPAGAPSVAYSGAAATVVVP